MSPAATQEEGGEGSASQSRAGRWLRRTLSRAGQSEQPASSQRRRREGTAKEQSKGSSAVGKTRAAAKSARMTSDKSSLEASASALAASKRRPRAGKEQSRKRKRTMAANEGRVGEETALSRSRSNMGDKAAASFSAATERESSSEASSAVSSPLRVPYISQAYIVEPFWKIDPAIEDAHSKLWAKHSAKSRNQVKNLVTLDENVPHSVLDWDCPRLEPVRESVIEMVLKLAGVVFGLSSYIDGNLLKRASGFLIDWDKESKIGTILTSALLICSNSTSVVDEWSGTDEYAPHAEVYVHLLDKHDTVERAKLMHYHKHFNFALFKFKIDLVTQIPSFSEVKFGQEAFVLGRDENMHLIVDHGTVPHVGPSDYERNHYMFTSCEINECAPGGPVLNLTGQFVGMVNRPNMAFTSSSFILKFFDMLKKFDCIPRLHTGMKFSSLKFLDPVHREKIIRKCGIDMGLIVTEVSAGSVAEKVGIRIGDIIECWNGESVSTTVELESLLLHMSEEHLDNGGCIGSNVDVPVVIFLVRKDRRRRKMLTVKISDDVEVIVKGKYAITAADCATVSNDDDVNSGPEAPVGTSENLLGGN